MNVTPLNNPQLVDMPLKSIFCFVLMYKSFFPYWLFAYKYIEKKRSAHNFMVNILYCDIVVSEFLLQSHYYVHCQTNTFEKCMNFLIPFS